MPKPSKAKRERQRRKQQRRALRRERRATKREQPLASRIRDPVEIVLRVLMARGLPMELARRVLFDYRAIQTPTARAFDVDRSLKGAFRSFDTWGDGEPDLHACSCTWDDWHGLSDRDSQALEAATWRQGCGKQCKGRPPVTLAAACHTRTTHVWRADAAPGESEWMQSTYGREGVQCWTVCSDSCSLTRLRYQVWLNARGLEIDRQSLVPNKEFSFVKWLREAPMFEMLRVIELNLGHPCVGVTRQERVAVLVGELDWVGDNRWVWQRHP